MIKWGGKNWRPGSPAKRQPINQSIEELMKPLGEKLHKGNVWQVVMNVPEQTSAPDITPSPTPTNTQTPSVTPTNTNTPTPTITPSETSGACSLYILGAGGSGSNFTWINCNGTPGSIYLPNSDTTEVCGKDGTFTFDGAGSALNMGPCPSPTPTPTNTPTPSVTPASYSVIFVSSGETFEDLCSNPQPIPTLYSPQPFFTDTQQLYYDSALTQFIDWSSYPIFASTGGTQLYGYLFANMGLSTYGFTC
jgi:hypothetical protein